MNPYTLYLLMVVLWHLILGSYALFYSPKGRLNLIFCLFAIGLAAWTLSIALISNGPGNPLTSLPWATFFDRLAFVGAMMAMASLFHFSLIFPEEKLTRLRKILIGVDYGVTLLLFLSLILGYISQGDWASRHGPVFPAFGIYVILLFLASMANFIRKFPKAEPLERYQLGYVILGVGLAGIGGITTNVIIPLIIPGALTVNLGPSFTIFVTIFCLYSILKYRLLYVKMILPELAIYLVVTLTLLQTLLAKTLGEFLFPRGLIFLLTLILGLWLLRELKVRVFRPPWGRVIDESHHPVEYAIIRVYDSRYKKLVATQVTDREGRYSFLVRPGSYFFSANKEGFQEFKSQGIEIFQKDKAAINQEISLRPA